MAIYDEAKALMEKILHAEEITAIAAYVEDPVQWWIDAIVNKAGSRMKAIVTEHTNLNASKLSRESMQEIIKDMDLETAKSRKAREMAEMEAQFNKPTAPIGRT